MGIPCTVELLLSAWNAAIRKDAPAQPMAKRINVMAPHFARQREKRPRILAGLDSDLEVKSNSDTAGKQTRFPRINHLAVSQLSKN